MVLSPELAERVERVEYRSDRMMAVVLKLEERRICLIQVYAPHQGRPQDEKAEFYEQLQDLHDSINVELKILMGDFNAHIGRDREGVETVVGAYGVGERNPEGERLLDFCVRNNLAVMNTFYAHRESQKFTWYRWNSVEGRYVDKSMIDMFLVNDKRIARDVKSIPSVSLDSDHRLVLGKFKLRKPQILRSICRERLAVEKLKEVDIKELLNIRLADCKPTYREEFKGVEEEWRMFRDTVGECSRETLGV